MSTRHGLTLIADALGMCLHYERRRLSGSSTGTMKLPMGCTLQLRMTVVGFFVNQQIGVLVHAAGDLYILAGVNHKTRIPSIYLLDGSSYSNKGIPVTPEQLIRQTMTLRDAVEALRGGIVASFLYNNRAWSVFKLPT